jgi:protein involved in polysaccharide export with SLBB domain
MVGKPGAYPPRRWPSAADLGASGISEFRRQEIVVRTENRAPKAIKFNYEEVRKGTKLQQNIELQPSDTVLVP